MNDFTKEELESMANWGEVYTEFGLAWNDDINRIIINKIQSMIDNYCDHDGEKEQIACGAGKFNKCEKCGDFYKV